MKSSLFVALRSRGETNVQWRPIGRLEHDNDVFRFLYTHGADGLEGFSPLPGMPDLDVVYESDDLFPLFANRLLAPSRPEYQSYLEWGGFSLEDPPDPIAMLGVTEGRRATDSFEVFPCPKPDRDGCYSNKFFLHGMRYVSTLALERIARLEHGELLALMPDTSNAHDSHAVAVQTCDAHLVGYVPRYLAQDVQSLLMNNESKTINLTVERINRDAPLQHRVLCRIRATWPDSFSPCSGEEYQPVVLAHLR